MKVAPKHNRSMTRTYRYQPANVERVQRLAAELHVYPSRVVDSLLTWALDQVDAGRLVVRTRAVAWEIDRLDEA